MPVTRRGFHAPVTARFIPIPRRGAFTRPCRYCTATPADAFPLPDGTPGRRLYPVEMPESTDEALMLAYAAGDVSAFEQLYAASAKAVSLFAAYAGSGLADELFQDVWQSSSPRAY